MRKILFISLCLTIFQNAKSQIANQSDSLALVSLYNNTGGSNWYNGYGSKAWLIGPVNNWGGVTLNSSGRVVSIDLSYINLRGAIPTSFGNLNMLTSVVLTGNYLTGNIPSSITSLSNLNTLDLSYNQLSGSIPTSLYTLVNLTNIDLSSNKLTGTIPSSIGSIQQLTSLNLAGNQLTGSIPSSIGSLFNLTSLNLANNLLSGAIPSSISNLYRLNTLRLFNNQLTGSIPSDIGFMTNLGEMSLYSNQLSGEIPSTISYLRNLTSITIFDNKFTFAGMDLVANFVFSQKNGGSGYRNYSGQAIIPLKNNKNLLSVSVGGNPSNNSFYWYKDGAYIGATYSDSTFTATAAGKYWVEAHNSVCSALTLYSDTITVYNLPVLLNNFFAQINNNQNCNLIWQTASELNTNHFIIQHSTDGLNFKDIGIVKAIGSGANNYSFIDNNVSQGINYYRLLCVDKNGSSTCSKIVTTEFAKFIDSISITPNPAKDFTDIKFSRAIDNGTVRVFDISGKEVIKQAISKQSTLFHLNTQALFNGVYIVKVETDKGSCNRKILINK